MTTKDKPLILSLETAAGLCSVALSQGEDLLFSLQSEEKNSHSQMLPLLIEKIFSLYGENIRKDLDAVAVSKGPGSYTGLRIGVSSAKGLAYALNIPLISVETLKILAFRAMTLYPDMLYLPMIDARRMEVYSALYDSDFNCLKEISADIIESDIYKEYQKDKKIAVIGDGAQKCKSVLNNGFYIYDDNVSLHAEYMCGIALSKYKNGDFEDKAYFEPYYLKDFIAKKSSVKGLY